MRRTIGILTAVMAVIWLSAGSSSAQGLGGMMRRVLTFPAPVEQRQAPPPGRRVDYREPIGQGAGQAMPRQTPGNYLQPQPEPHPEALPGPQQQFEVLPPSMSGEFHPMMYMPPAIPPFTLPLGRRYINGRYYGELNNRFYGPQYGYF